MTTTVPMGVPPEVLNDEELQRELATLHRMRHETFLHAGRSALETHTDRTEALENEYLRRFPERDIDEQRTRSGARQRA